MKSTLLHTVLPIGLGLVCVVAAFLIVRRWRREYLGAKELRAHLENTVKTQAEALSALTAQISVQGNVVNIGDQFRANVDSSGDAQRAIDLWIPASVLSRANRRTAVVEALDDEHERISPELVESCGAGLDYELSENRRSDNGADHGRWLRRHDR